MRSDRYYFISSLPVLGELGSTPPIGFAKLMEHVSERLHLGKMIGSLFLFDDLIQRQAFLCGEISEVDPVVLSSEQARNEGPLPDYLAPSGDLGAGAVETDGLWGVYFRYVADVARTANSRFLSAWVGFEVALRNALASARARRLGIEEAGYLLATGLADDTEDFTAVLGEWRAAATPLAGLRAVIRGQWEWLDRHDPWFSFSDDELAVYAARLMLLHQWRRSSSERATQP